MAAARTSGPRSGRKSCAAVAMIPGAEAVGITDNLPMSRNRSWGIRAKGGDYDGGKFQGAFVYIVSPGYLKAIGMRLLRGRDIGWEDAPKSEKVVIINETVAQKLWPGQDPIGRIAEVAGGNARVIGVIADVRETNAEERRRMANVLARQPVWAGRRLSGGEVEAASRHTGSERDENAAPDQFGTAGDGVQTHSEPSSTMPPRPGASLCC